MSSEYASLEPKLKEILYRCLEEIRATKAALFLSTSEEVFELITFYGFREIERKQIAAKDDLIDRLVVKRTPFFLNSLTEDPRFSQMMFASGSTRMLIAPIYSRGRLVGFVDMRDKASKQPFAPQDLLDAQKIVDEFLDLFSQKNLFGQQRAQSMLQPQRPVFETPGELSNALGAIDEAKRVVGRGLGKRKDSRETLTEEQLKAGAVVLPAFLGLPGVLFAALSSCGRFAGTQIVASRAEFKPEATAKFEAHLRGWLQKRGEPEGLTASSVVFPLGKGAVPFDASRIGSVVSAPVEVASLRGVALTVGLEAPPSPEVQKVLGGLLRSAEKAVNHALSHDVLGSVLLRVAENLIEPYSQRFTVLMGHGRRVSDNAARLATAAGLSHTEIERARLTGLVHDVGMRQLDYHTLYRKPTLNADEMKILKEHPTVGAALVADSALGPEIAQLVLCHHERPDGTGYPGGLKGEEIPVVSRIVHICEAYDAMTSSDSYQTPMPQAAALARIRRVAGSQLDPGLAVAFAEMISKPEAPPLR